MIFRNRLLIVAIVALGTIWTVVFAVTKFAGSRKPTAEKIVEFDAGGRLAQLEGRAERRALIDEMASKLNKMDPAEVSALAKREDDPRRVFYEAMTPKEQHYFLEQRMGRAFEQMIHSFNEMDRDERRRIVKGAMSRLSQDREETEQEKLAREDPELVARIVNRGFKAFYSEASIETKIDLAPLLEKMQEAMGKL